MSAPEEPRATEGAPAYRQILPPPNDREGDGPSWILEWEPYPRANGFHVRIPRAGYYRWRSLRRTEQENRDER